MYRSGSRSSSAWWCWTDCRTKHSSTSSTSASLSPVSPPDNIFALPAKVFSSCLAIVSAVMVGGLFLWPALRHGTGYQTVWEIRPSAETPSSVHWRRLYFQLTRVHSALELFGRCALQIYLLTYLLTYVTYKLLNVFFSHLSCSFLENELNVMFIECESWLSYRVIECNNWLCSCVCIMCYCFILHICCIIVSTVGWTWLDWSLILRTLSSFSALIPLVYLLTRKTRPRYGL